MDTTAFLESQTMESRPGVVENPNGGYHVHVRLNERGMAVGGLLGPHATMPPGTPVLAEMLVFEDCVLLALQEGNAIVLHVSDPEAAGSVVYFYHSDGSLWRAVPLEQLNPGWVCSTYCFRADLHKFEARLERMRAWSVRPSWKTSPTFWATGGCAANPGIERAGSEEGHLPDRRSPSGVELRGAHRSGGDREPLLPAPGRHL
jgi:hypothetical protein